MPGNLFFPGATRFARHRGRNRCLWREKQFMLQQTVSPTLCLRKSVDNWFEISCALRESPRKRTAKMEEIEAQEMPMLS